MPIDLTDPKSNELAKLFFFFELELENLPECQERRRLRHKFASLREAVEENVDFSETCVNSTLSKPPF